MAHMTLLLLIPLGLISSAFGNVEIQDRMDALAEALFDPAPAFAAYPNAREARANGLGSIAEALGGGGSSGFFGSVFSGVAGALNKFSSALGGPPMPSGMAKTLESLGSAAAAAPAPAPGAWKPPRMSRPGPEVFRAMEARRKKVKGIRNKRQISVKAFKQFDGLNKNLLNPNNPFGGELMTILQAVAKMWSGMGAITRTPVSRMKGQMNGFRDSAEALATKVSNFPNEIFGAIRSKRQIEDLRDNEVRQTIAELAGAHQKNWFTYLRSYNGTAQECHELEFCVTAQKNNDYSTPTARSGGKILSYLVSGLRDSRGNAGERFSQAVDCCLSEDLVQAEACRSFYQQQCLEADLKYQPPRD